jgi:hypothetical protein
MSRTKSPKADKVQSHAANVMTLLPGNHTVQVCGLNNTPGVALVEVYALP